jgi:hypothetical protein
MGGSLVRSHSNLIDIVVASDGGADGPRAARDGVKDGPAPATSDLSRRPSPMASQQRGHRPRAATWADDNGSGLEGVAGYQGRHLGDLHRRRRDGAGQRPITSNFGEEDLTR